MWYEEREALIEKHSFKMLEQLPVAVLIVDISGRPLYINRSAQNLLSIGLQDLDPEAVINDLSKVFCAHMAGTGQLYPRKRSPLSKALTGEISTVDDMEIRQQGQAIPVEVSAAPIFNDRGEISFAIAVFKDIADRKKVERELSQRRDELESLIAKARTGRRRLQILSRKRIDVQEAERRGLARELHDEIGQALTAIKIHLQGAMRVPEAASVESHLTEGIGIVERVLQQVRNLSLDLRPSMLDDLGLMAALRWYLDRQSQTSGIKIAFIGDPSIERFPQEIETTCFRLVQEALTNILRHARASEVHVEIAPAEKGLQLVIRDNGIGFDVSDAMEHGRSGESSGLLGMEERAILAGGEINLKSRPGEGAEIRVFIPLDLKVVT